MVVVVVVVEVVVEADTAAAKSDGKFERPGLADSEDWDFAEVSPRIDCNSLSNADFESAGGAGFPQNHTIAQGLMCCSMQCRRGQSRLGQFRLVGMLKMNSDQDEYQHHA